MPMLLSPDEEARLKELSDYEILDTLPDAAFDSITRLAARIFDVPIVLISLVDRDRQWFKSHTGIDVTETAREISLCSHSIVQEDMLIIPDARKDSLLASNAVVTGEPFVRFYAGAPLTTPAGYRLGVLCVIDTKPREFSAEERETLRDLASLVMDEFELRRVQNSLSDNEKRFKNAFELSPYGISLVAPDGKWLRVNPALCDMLGYSEAELLEVDFQTVTYAEDLEDDLKLVQELLDGTCQQYQMEKRYIHKSGRNVWGLLTVSLVRNENGEPKYFVSQVNDITAKKLSEEGLLESEALNASIIANSLDAILTVNADSKILEWNPAAERVFGYTRDEALGRGMDELIIPLSLRQMHREGIARYTQTGEPRILNQRLELPALRKDGSEILVELIVTRSPVKGETLFTAFLRDITERKRYEQQLRLLESVVVNARESILISEATPESKVPLVVYANEAFTRDTGYAPEEMIGKDPHSLQGPTPDAYVTERIAEAYATNTPAFLEVINYRKDGTPFWVELSMFPVSDEAGKVTHWVHVKRDVTQRKHDQQQLQLAKEDSERANLAKSEFLSRMSHELRTPLNGILGFAQIMQMEQISPVHREIIDDIHSAGRHLLSLINEVLDISRIESGNLSLSLEPVSVDDVMQEVVSLISPLAAQRGISIIAAEHSWQDRFVLADRQRLNQAMINLLSNAVKYNKDGGRIALQCVQADDGCLKMCVSDTGQGIAEDKLDRLFTPFDRLGAEKTRIEGTGLGLALTRRIIEAMKGELTVQSKVGEGTAFGIVLPTTTPIDLEAIANSPLPPSLSSGTHTVLYVEDNLQNLRVIELIFARRPNIRLISAMQGNLALDLATQHRPDVILLDLHLPDIDGGEVLMKLKSEEITRDIPVIMLSADATQRQIDRLTGMGAINYFTKPFDVPQFLSYLDSILSAKS